MARIMHNRTETVAFTLSPKEKAILQNKALQAGISLSAYCRIKLLGDELERGVIVQNVR